MSKVMNVVDYKCVGCRICEQWCSYAHGKAVGPSTTSIRIQRLHHAYKIIPVVCRQCAKPACIETCSFEALSRNNTTGAVVVDETKCTGCRKCVKECPYGAINYDSSAKIVRICDLCGGEPACVAHCPEKVLEYREEDSIINEYRRSIVEAAGRKCHD